MSQMPPPQQPYQQQSPPPHYGQPHLPAPGIALAAMILGIIAIITSPLLLFGIIALIVGLVAVSQTGAHTGRKGRGMAVAGTVMGGSSLVLGLVMVLLIGIMLPALGAARRTARRMQNSTQLRGMHQGMMTFSNSNNDRYPGLNSKGEILRDDAVNTGNSGDGDTVEARMWIMLDGNFFTPQYAISPSETAAITEYQSGPVSASNYSYALLSIQGEPEQEPDAEPRAMEWTQSMNMQAIVASDRNTGSNATANLQSVHSTSPGQWKGSILWNDNHVAFEQTHILETRYGNGSLNADPSFQGTDNIFAPAGDADAWMIYSGN